MNVGAEVILRVICELSRNSRQGNLYSLDCEMPSSGIYIAVKIMIHERQRGEN